MLRGLATISFWADDLAAAKQWYTELLGCEPYFERPGYIEFRLGDYQHELGIIDRRYAPAGSTTVPSGAVVYWHVDDVETTFKRLLAMGAKEYETLTERGEGFITASVVDPFGNILGIMYNQHYLAILDAIPARHSGSSLPSILEVVLFRAKAGVSDEEVLQGSAQIQPWLAGAAGYLKREVSKGEDGQWVDIVHWRSLAEAQQAAEQLMAEPTAAEFMRMLDPESITMLHVQQQVTFGG
jgi:predicted enzyme related to lactoylglutathione lyase